MSGNKTNTMFLHEFVLKVLSSTYWNCMKNNWIFWEEEIAFIQRMDITREHIEIKANKVLYIMIHRQDVSSNITSGKKVSKNHVILCKKIDCYGQLLVRDHLWVNTPFDILDEIYSETFQIRQKYKSIGYAIISIESISTMMVQFPYRKYMMPRLGKPLQDNSTDEPTAQIILQVSQSIDICKSIKLTYVFKIFISLNTISTKQYKRNLVYYLYQQLVNFRTNIKIQKYQYYKT